MNRKNKIIVSVAGITIVLLALLGLTYGYYLTRIQGNTNTNSISVISSKLELVYGDDNGNIIGDGEIIEPNKTFETKTFSVENKGSETIESYGVILENVSIIDAITGKTVSLGSTTEDVNNDFELIITCTNGSEKCNGYNSDLPEQNEILLTNSIKPGEKHIYSVVLTYKETYKDQSDDMNKSITGKFNIINTKNTAILKGKVINVGTEEYFVQVNSVKRISQIDYNKEYKILGLEVGNHILKLCKKSDNGCSNPVLTKNITIKTGDLPSANNSTGIITINNDYNVANITIDVSNLSIEINKDLEFNNPYNYDTLAYHILNNGALVEGFQYDDNGIPVSTGTQYNMEYIENTTISKVSDGTDMADVGIFMAPDDYGISYYFRGTVRNNYVNFAGFTWRVIRINGDGSVRLILNDTLKNTAACEDDTICIDSVFNTLYKDNAYVGYMYGNQGEIDSYDNTHMNVNDSDIKKVVDKFYEKYIQDSKIYLADTLFCGDKTISSGTGIGLSETNYSAFDRMWNSPNTPTLECAKNATNTYSRYTSKMDMSIKTSKGVAINNDLDYPIGLISADEIIFAGGTTNWNGMGYNDNYYLVDYSGNTPASHTMTPIYIAPNYNEYFMLYFSYGADYININTSAGVRPVINLKNNVLVESGNGTSGSGAYNIKIVN